MENKGWYLGLVYNKDGILINHRSLLKVVINPFLRPFKICIASKFNVNYTKLEGYKFIQCDYVSLRDGLLNIKYDLLEGYYVKKTHTII